MRPCSSPYEDPFGPVFGDPEVDAACGPAAWLASMLAAEAALADALAAAGVIPDDAAKAIGEACRSDAVTTDVFALAASASPVVPLVAALGEAVPPHAAGWVHYGATSQDIMHTAMMLVSQRATAVISERLAAAAGAAASLADRHRDTLQIGRTLGQHAAPTTFGTLAAGWLGGIDAARAELDRARRGLAAQLGGPVGILEGHAGQGLPILRDFARRLGLADPVVPWHTERTRPARLAAALAMVAGGLGKVARDVTVLGSGDVGEL
ncbi:MAG TPA: lyase family protein, partial [Stackebrandtia sp.]|uniref:lyase family protein n=1 Tax=Stackebrandtia sp. TaxID=2023065 RepID=UPI002D40173A